MYVCIYVFIIKGLFEKIKSNIRLLKYVILLLKLWKFSKCIYIFTYMYLFMYMYIYI